MRHVQVASVLLLALVIAVWLINAFIVVVTRERIVDSLDKVPQVEAVVVPGASVFRSGKLSPVLERRMEAGLRFLASRDGVYLVLSGYAIPNGYNETAAMLDHARRKAVPPERILSDEKGRSTYVTMLNCKRRFGLRRILVVSQDYHLPRSLYIASGLGLEAFGFAVERSPSQRFHLREYISRFKDFILLRVSGLFNAR